MGLFGGDLGEIANIGMAAIPGIGQYLGAQETNAANMQIAQDATRTNVATAREQMAFQERMSNTAHQREVEDLKKAGLNPILAAQGGASAPPGAAGQAVAAKLENPAAGVSESVMQAVGTYLKGLEVNASVELAGAQKMKAITDAKKAGVETKVIEKDIPKSDVINKMYKLIEPYFDKLRKALGSNAKGVYQHNRDAAKEWETLTGKKPKWSVP